MTLFDAIPKVGNRILHFFDSDSDSDDDSYAYGAYRMRWQVGSVVRALVFSWRTESWKVAEDFALQSIKGRRELKPQSGIVYEG